MLEQSGRLLVPKLRTSSWYRNAASLLVRPGGVEQRLVGALECMQVLGDQPVGLIPADRAVVVLAWSQHHRVGQPQPCWDSQYPAGQQIGNRMAGEEIRPDHPAGGFLGDGLGAVLAELDRLAPARFLRPGAPRQSKPSRWLTRARAATVRVSPIWATLRRSATRTAGIPAADVARWPISIACSS